MLEDKMKPNKIDDRGVFERSIMFHRQKVYTVEPTFKAAENVDKSDHYIPICNKREIPARIFRPKNIAKEGNTLYPTLFYIPGTAFVAFENKFSDVVCSHIAANANCQIIVLYHSLAPEDKFPQGYKDAFSLFSHFIKIEADSYKIDTSKIAIAGYSSGGNFAALMAVQAINEGIPFNRQILLSPLVDLSRTVRESPVFQDIRKFEEQDKAITEDFVRWFLDLYIPNGFDPRNPNMSPYWQSNNKIKTLPPTDIILAEFDRFRVDAEAYYNKLQEAGVNVTKNVISNENHAYLWHNLSIVDKVSERLKIAFKDAYVDRPVPSTLIYLKPNNPKNIQLLEKEKPQNKTGIQQNACSAAVSTVEHLSQATIMRRVSVFFKHFVTPLPKPALVHYQENTQQGQETTKLAL